MADLTADTATPSDPSSGAAYQVLARKYRPNDFSTLIGQDAMVRTLENAIKAGRLAHAFVLTGVRGVGKTTTARIIAKGLNCENRDGPSVDPCGVCDSCLAIGESRHVDVLEMDAASRTGIDDIREIIESVRYAPVSARYKVYIIDEVHMLSNQAFNGLLKTLEEPPAHVKFLFATTEIRKLPVTVLSRCQRFDLRRVEMPTLIDHLGNILTKEGLEADEDALAMIARAAEGSVRDSLSLLDQAIAHAGGKLEAQQVSTMLGYADRGQIRDLFESLMKGEAGGALARLRTLYDRGADPVVVISDLMEMTHALTRVKVAPDAIDQDAMSDAEKNTLSEMARKLSMPILTRAWQMLLKGLGEVRGAPRPIAAAEMLMVRLAYVADLPDPGSLVKQLQSGGGAAAGPAPSGSAGATGGGQTQAVGRQMAPTTGPALGASPGPTSGAAPAVAQVVPLHDNHTPSAKHPAPVTFDAMVDLFKREKEVQLAVHLTDMVRLVDFKPGHVSFSPVGKPLPSVFLTRLKACLQAWTGENWMFTLTRDESGGQSLRERDEATKAALRVTAKEDPLAKAFLKYFPDAELGPVKPFELVEEPLDMIGTEAAPDSAESGDFDADSDDYGANDGDFDF